MITRKLTARLALLAAAAFAILSPYVADSVNCENAAARNLLTAAYLDTAINPSGGEDLDFLYQGGSVPNIMVLFDSSKAMRMLPPDGPGHIGGLTPSLPPGFDITDPTSATEQTAADAATVAGGRIVGCGLDDVSRTTATWIGSDVIKGVMARAFYPPCGQATDSSLVGQAFRGQSTDYAANMTVCPYFTSSNNQAVGASGYDPDFYGDGGAGPTDTTGNGKPVFFGRDLVFHDAALAAAYDYANTKFNGNMGDGWDDRAVYPFKTGSGNSALGTIATFCATQGTTLQGTRTREAICNQCLTTAGWYYDGIHLGQASDPAGHHPSFWYTGNYLNFFPPKFLVARKIVKDVIAVRSRVRMALARFSGNAGASIIRDFNPSCGQPDSSNFDSNRAAYVSDINSSSLTFTDESPLAKALFDIGDYYHSPDLTWFGSTGSMLSASNANQYSVCYSCQASNVIILSGGLPTVNDGSTLPPLGTTTAQATGGLKAGDPVTGILGIASGACPQCAAGTPDYLNNLPRVAWYMHNMDLRRDDETTLDCKGMPGAQVLNVYTLGFGTSQLGAADQVLTNAAKAGGGISVSASNPAALLAGLQEILTDISTRSTSFSVATISTLQTTAGRAVIVPRFDPAKTAHWKGHLFRFDLYSEFVNTCTPSGAGDLDCDGKCTSTFLADNSGTNDATPSLITQDGTGAFVRNSPTAEPTCDLAAQCVASGKCAVGSSTAANPFWDAGALLAARSWASRYVYTVVDRDSNGVQDGKIDQRDVVFRLQPTDAVATKVAPYLALGTNASGVSVCTTIASKLDTAGDAASGTLVRSSQLECAKTIIRYVLGADVFNEMAVQSPTWPPASEDSLWDRPYKLGDVFHSSPVVVDPPSPRLGILCHKGLQRQCLQSLWRTDTQGGESGYDGYSLDTQYYNRNKVILVGANDGLLHAFLGGSWRAGLDDPYTSAVNESLAPFNGYFDRGTGEELWAFAPPDLLAKVPMLLGSQHQFYVDGTAMIRDVWVDGTSNGLAAASTRDDKKQKQEFHTVAVVGERRGGTRFFGLDVTNAASAGTPPGFLWVYPQPNDARSLTYGETYDEFLPLNPPIGPVRIQADASFPAIANVTPQMTVPGAATNPVPYHERWVVFLNGGFDPQYVRGRGVHMLDVWTGQELFDFSYSTDAADVRNNLKYPVAALPSMMGWGESAYLQQLGDHKWYFNTATFADTGGQEWTLRFYYPGELDANGHVTNWFGGRSFQMTGCDAQPFFNMPGDAPVTIAGAGNFVYRSYLGTGDRFNLLDLNGGTCGPDNLRACVMRGCTVTVDATSNYLEAPDVGIAQRGLSQVACGAASNTVTDGTLSTCTVAGRARIAITNCPGNLSTTKDFQVSCSETATGYRCDPVLSSAGSTLAISNTTNPITAGNWFFSLLIFQQGTNRDVFSDAAGAQRYDSARITVNQTGMSTFTATSGLAVNAATNDGTNPATPLNLAGLYDPGWAIRYDHGPTVTVDYHQFTVAWQDERTTTLAASTGDIMSWYTTQPTQGDVVSVSAGCRASKCTAAGRRISQHYLADAVTGNVVAGLTSGGASRSVAAYQMVPSQGDQATVFVNQQGQVAVGLTSVNPEKGATNVGMTNPVDPTSDAGYLEVDAELHACRHVDGVTTTPVCR